MKSLKAFVSHFCLSCRLNLLLLRAVKVISLASSKKHSDFLTAVKAAAATRAYRVLRC
jgi:hypothetical protein